MRILGLDPSLTGFGWVLLDTIEGDGDRATHLKHGTFKTNKRTPMPWRYKSLRESLAALIQAEHHEGTGIDFVGIEHPPFSASYSLGLYALYMDIWEVLLDARLPFVLYLPSQLKAYARRRLGEKGKMSKQDMKDLFLEIFDYEGRFNNNVADAGICGFMASRFALLIRGHISEDDLLDYEQDMYTKNTVSRKTGKERFEGYIFNEGEDGKYIDYPSAQYDSLYENADENNDENNEADESDEQEH